MERLDNSLRKLNNLEATEVLTGMKQFALILQSREGSSVDEYLFRPESGVRLTIDRRIPKPQELDRDVVFHRVARLVGWNITLPVEPYTFEDEKGAIRPFYRNIKKIEPYELKYDSMKDSDFWVKTAVLDYMCGIVDRVSNDILIIDNQKRLVDSGLSFVEGSNFTVLNSVVRKILRGVEIDEKLLNDIFRLNWRNIKKETSGLITDQEMKWVLERRDLTLRQKKVL